MNSVTTLSKTKESILSKPDSIRVIGVGASAGGLEALKSLVSNLPANLNACYVVAQHLAPHYRSMLTELLDRETSLKVIEAKSNMSIKTGTIYITPPNKDIWLSKNKIRLRKVASEIGPKPSIDYFFASLAKAKEDRAVGIVLSGTGSDGTQGLRAIKAAGGISIAQSAETAKYDGMPNSAIRSGFVDLVLAPSEIGKALSEITFHVKRIEESIPSTEIDHYGRIIESLSKSQNVDFSNYKDSTIRRQIERRMATLQFDRIDKYEEYIAENTKELDILFHNSLISVTSFFRDPQQFEGLTTQLKKLLSSNSLQREIRVWVPGCATGEEAYSIAISILELLRDSSSKYLLKIFATDLDNAALEFARRGIYLETALENIDQKLVEQYFTRHGRAFQIRTEIRELAVFARQNVFQDPPFVHLDLVSCRNLLIYFNNELQEKVFRIFNYALKKQGILFLGKSEGIGQNNPYFKVIDKQLRIYKPTQLLTNLAPRYDNNELRGTQQNLLRKKKRDKNHLENVHSTLFNNYVPPTVLIDGDYNCLHFFGEINRYLNLREGRIDYSLLNLVPSSIRVNLRGLIGDAAKNSEKVCGRLQNPTAEGKLEILEVSIIPVDDLHYGNNCFLVSIEVCAAFESQRSGIGTSFAKDKLEKELQDELDNTRDNLQAVIEELETSNEELQSMNEELQASAEEVQAANEELETTNEELQATNEELCTVNEELRVKSNELIEAKAHLENIQASLDIGLLVVDRRLRVLKYSERCVRILGMLPTDVGHSLNKLESHVLIPELSDNIKSVIQSTKSYSAQFQHNYVDYLMRINPYRFADGEINGAVITFTDITLLKKAEEELKLRNLAIESAADGIVISDATLPDQPVIYVSPAFTLLTGYDETEAIGTNCRFLQGPETDRQTISAIRTSINQKQPFLGELINYRKDGSHFWNQLSIKPLTDNTGRVRYWVGVLTDITDRKRREAVFHRQANYDPLTGLPNRNLLHTRLNRQLEKSHMNGDSLYIMFIDLDGFKEINDTLGHNIGDDLLIQAASRLQKCVRENDTVARFGGDEFVLILPEIQSLDIVIRIANNILHQLRVPFRLVSGTHQLSASIGIAAYPEDAKSAETLIQHADTAMYRVKNNGRDDIAFFQPQMNTEAVEQSQLKQALFLGLEKHEFELHFQPIYNIKENTISGAETLVRWNDPERGFLTADCFIPIAEQTGQIISIGQWILENAVKQLINWIPKLDKNFRLAINLSPRQLHDESLKRFLDSLSESLLEHLEFEITESIFLEQQHSVVELLNMIREKKGRVSIDDFGVGYSSLKYLKQLPVDTIKIDREFISTSTFDTHNLAIIDAILSIANSIGAFVVAEGVENHEQLDLLKSKPCNYAQGFYYSKPLPAQKFEELLH